MKEFRLLKAEEIETRLADKQKIVIAQGYVQLLLYKDARCDMNILDETVGPMNWKKSYSRNNANCILSIWDAEKMQWIEKEDSGSTGNSSERDKSLASDSFKRAAVASGIGRELYTGPKIFFPLKYCSNYTEDWCSDKFEVTGIEYEGRNIKTVTILNEKSRAEIQFGSRVKLISAGTAVQTAPPAAPVVTEDKGAPKAPDTEVDIKNNLPFK